jgi:hypothetical protein
MLLDADPPRIYQFQDQDLLRDLFQEPVFKCLIKRLLICHISQQKVGRYTRFQLIK